MSTNRFTWGKALDHFSYDFDGQVLEVVKFHPWKRDGCTVLSGKPDESKIQFHVEEMHESFHDIQTLLVAWITCQNLGRGNNDSLIYGICRALEITTPKAEQTRG